jgi:hypothetical protein
VLGAPGLASRYPGDDGIARDPSVLLAADFEGASLEHLARDWDDVSNAGGKVLSFVPDSPPGSPGRTSLQMEATLGENTGGHLYTRLPRGVDRIYARFYVKFKDPAYTHHFVRVAGYNPPTRWPQGRAGTRPSGDDWLSVAIEPFGDRGRTPAPGRWGFYNYWHEMKQSAAGKSWGNGLGPAARPLIPLERWICIEIMVQLNEPGLRNGELALWIDGVQQAHVRQGVRRTPWTGMGFDLLESGGEPFEGFSWRTGKELQINTFWLLHYVTESAYRQNGVADPPKTNRVRFDHVVLATEYVGPLVAKHAGASGDASALRRSGGY